MHDSRIGAEEKMIGIKIDKNSKQEILKMVYDDAKGADTGLLSVLAVKKNKNWLQKNYPELHNLFYSKGKVNECEVKKLLGADRATLQNYIAKLGKYDKAKSDELQNRIFRYKNFSVRNVAYEILKKMNMQVCPYCNRQYIVTLKNNKVRPQFDHYYPKSDYPYLALSVFNLIPCCSICNMAKTDLDTSATPILYPYDEEFAYEIRFTIKEKDGINLFQYASGRSDEFDVGITNPNNVLLTESTLQIEKLHLIELYNEHKDYVKAILRHHYVYTDKRIKELYNSFPELFKSTDDVKNSMHMSYLQKEDWGKRPLAKLTCDILDDIQGIVYVRP